MSPRLVAATFFLALAAAACGGAEDAGPTTRDAADGTIRVTFSPVAIDRDTWEDWGSGASTYLTATLSPVPAEPPYVALLVTGEAFSPGAVTVTQVAPESFRASLPHAALPPGTYTGTVTLDLCRDVACASRYALSQSTVPYTVRVHDVVAGLGQVTAIVQVDGAMVTSAGEVLSPELSTYAISTPSGRVVDLIPSEPFITRSGYCSGGAAIGSAAGAPAPGSWRATIAFLPGTTDATGWCELSGRAEGGRTVRLTVNISR